MIYRLIILKIMSLMPAVFGGQDTATGCFPRVLGVMMHLGDDDFLLEYILPAIAIFIFIIVSLLVLTVFEWPASWAIWTFLSIVLVVITVVLCILGGPAAFWGIGFIILLVGLLLSYGITSQLSIAVNIISTIGSSVRQNLPLAMALDAAAGGRRDKYSRILRKIHKWLVQGYSLSEALKRGYPKCPGYAVAMIASAERINQLPYALESIEADMLAKAEERSKIRPVHPLYPIILMSFMFVMIMGMMTFVIPKIAAVLSELSENEGFPLSTRILIRVASFIAYDYGWLLILPFAVATLPGIIIGIRVKFRPRNPSEPYLFSLIGDYLKWHLPILHWFEKNYSLIHTVEMLRLSLNSGSTVDKAVENAIDLDINICFKKRLRKWLALIQRGDDIADAARKTGISESVAWAFNQKINQGNTLAILDVLETFYRSNYSYRVNLLRFIAWPCITITMGLIVGFVVYSIFSPLVEITNRLSAQILP